MHEKCEVYVEHGRAGIWHGRAGVSARPGNWARLCNVTGSSDTAVFNIARPCTDISTTVCLFSTTMERPLSYRHGYAQVKHGHAELKIRPITARLGLVLEKRYKKGGREREKELLTTPSFRNPSTPPYTLHLSTSLGIPPAFKDLHSTSSDSGCMTLSTNGFFILVFFF